MKIFAICSVVGLLAFGVMGVQFGVIKFHAAPKEVISEPAAETPIKLRLKFPQDLVPASRAQAVPQAAAFSPSAQVYPLAIMKPNGQLHHWQEKLQAEWQAETVEGTQLVVVVVPQKEKFLTRHVYPGGAPPIERFQYELEASVVEAKTGKVLANQIFQNVPRNIRQVEEWRLTKIGELVQWRTVFNWVVTNAKAGFPKPSEAKPLVTVVGD